METHPKTPHKKTRFERETIFENNLEQLQSSTSGYQEETPYLDSPNKRFIIYFTIFSFTEYFLLYIFQRYFYLHKSLIYAPEQTSPTPLFDFEVLKFYFCKLCGIFLIVFNKKTGTDHIRLIIKEFRVNQSFLIFVILDILLVLCTIYIIRFHPIAVVLLIIHPKIIYQLLIKIFKRYQMRNGELFLIILFCVFLALIYFYGPEKHYYSILTIIFSGILFYASEELVNSHINLQEWDILRHMSTAFVAFLFFTKTFLTNDIQFYGFEWTDLLILVLILTLDFTRTAVVKRIQAFNKENTARIYFPLMLVFVGTVGILLDLVLSNQFLSLGEILGELIFLGGLVLFFQNDLKRLFFKQKVVDVDLNQSEELIIHQ